MQNQRKKAKLYIKSHDIKKACWLLAVCLLILALTAPFGNWMRERAEARLVLLKAKAVGLAVGNVVLEYYGTNQRFADQTGSFGITEDARSEIRKLSQCEGEYYLLKWDAENFRVKRSAYAEGDFTVIYALDEEGQQHWQIYRMEPMLED